MTKRKAHDLKIGQDLELRIVDEKYAREVFDLVTENFDHLNRWMPWATKDYTAKTAADYFRHSSAMMHGGNAADYSIFLYGRLIGGIGTNYFDTSNRSAEVGYWLAADQQGKGIVTRSCRSLLGFLFEEMNFNRVAIRCAPANAKSRGIPERLGFTEEGTLRQAELLNGTFVDLIVYSMLRPEWDKLKHQ